MSLAGISLTESAGQIFLRCEPMAERVTVDVATLYALLVQCGFEGCRLNEPAIAQAAQDCNAQGAPFAAHIADRCDATAHVDVSADDMSAWVNLTAAQGGKAISVEDLLGALADAGVVFGVDTVAVNEACAVGVVKHVLVASGVAPQAGQDSRFESLIPDASDRAPKVDDTGHIDYREHGGISVIKAGAALMRRTPATAGVKGQTVRGSDLPAKPGVDMPFALKLTGVELDANDPNLLLASAPGQPVLVQNGVMVEPVLHLKEVNMATGNIYFDGTVKVDGDVMQGMKVHASGDIVIGGTVEGGLLESGGDIRIACGVIAKSHLRAKGVISARFADNCTLSAGTVIALEDMALQCELESLNQIIIGEKAPQRGKLIGGSATTMMLLRVPILGSDKGGLTHIVVGANSTLAQQLLDLNLRIEQEQAAEDKLQKIVKQLTAAGDPKGMLDRVKVSWQHAVQVWSKSLGERVVLEAEIAVMMAAKVKIGVGVAGPVDLIFADKTVHLRKEFGAGQFAFDPLVGLVFEDASGRSVPLAP